MSTDRRRVLRCLWGLTAGVAVALSGCEGPQETGGGGDDTKWASTVTVDGKVGLHSLMSLADGHLQKVADAYSILAKMDSVRSAKWQQVREPLADAARLNVAGVYWFALPGGSYWTVEEGRAEANLADRAYFPRVLAGQTIIGELVVSRATGKSTAIVAVPVYGEGDKVVGVLGASIYLDRLSEQINEEMRLGPNDIFYSLDATPIVGLHKDTHTIFVHPLEEDDPQLTRAIREIISHEQGVVKYRFRGKARTIHYQRSPVTGWWYGFGKVY
jgi:hypothetical protein